MPETNMVILSPALNTQGASLYIDGREFSMPVQVPRGAQVSITFKKNGMIGRVAGASQMDQKIIVNDNMQYQMPQLEWFKLVSYQMVHVKADNGQSVPYRLYLNNREVTNGYGVYIPERMLARVQVRVEGSGYVVYDEAVDFASAASVEVVLRKEAQDLVVLINGVEFRSASGRTIQTINVEGYEFIPQGDKYRMEKVPGYNVGPVTTPAQGTTPGQWLGLVVIALFCLLIGVGVGWLIFYPKETKIIKPNEGGVVLNDTLTWVDDLTKEEVENNGEAAKTNASAATEQEDDKEAQLRAAQELARLDGEGENEAPATEAPAPETKVEKPAQQTVPTPAPAPATGAPKAYEALYHNKNRNGTELRQSELSKIPELNGLYEALAYYKRDQILNVYAPRINANDPNMADWARLVKAVRECPDVKFSATGYAISGNQSHNITVDGYIKLIKDRQKKFDDAKKEK